MRHTKISAASFAAAAAFGLISTVGSTAKAGFGIDINIGLPTPPRHHEEVVVLEYDRYCVGYRQALYDADWRLRNAQIEQFNAQQGLDDARHRESEVAIRVEDREAFVAGYEKRVADSDAALLAARASVAHAADDAAEARARVHAFEKRVAGARDDLDAARTLRDSAGIVDAEHRITTNEAAAAAAAADARAAEARVGDLQAAEAAAAALNEARAELVEARERLPRLREDLAVAHDGVFAAQQRVDAAFQNVALAMHDRDEALWMLHRDEIMTGRATLASCGFTVDLGVWGGRMPSDPEVVHAYFVHPTTYWVERPADIQVRVVEVDRVTEVTRIRVIQEKHEGPRFREVAHFEATVPVEQRRASFERVKIERETLVVERHERAAAAAEHRPVRLPESVRAEARAEVIKAHGDARSAQIEANGQARAEVTKARADARADQIEANGQAHAEVTKARADSRAEQIEANGQARAEVTKARADARSEQIEANGQAKAEVTKARADAKSEQVEAHGKAAAEVTNARADAKSERIEAHGKAAAEVTNARADSRSAQVEAHGKAAAETTKARADAKARETEAHADPKTTRAARDPKADNSATGPRASADKNSKDPKKKNANGQTAANDYNR